MPSNPKILWRYPTSGGLCSTSSDNFGTRTWCGTGWTGQPNVIVHEDGTIEVREGAYDGNYHFLDGLTGEQLHPDLVTGDLAKGSATSDADGYPLYYAGSRDNYLRVVAMDRRQPTTLWSFNSNSQPGGMWNDDWDGAPLQIGDYLLEGGENCWFYVIRLNRGYDREGQGDGGSADRDARPRMGSAAAERARRYRRLDRELGRVPRRRRVLRELGRARAGLGHLRHPEWAASTTSGSSGSGTGTKRTAPS